MKRVHTLSLLAGLLGLQFVHKRKPVRMVLREAWLKVTLGKRLRICPGGRHAWYQSSIGPIRKPLT